MFDNAYKVGATIDTPLPSSPDYCWPEERTEAKGGVDHNSTKGSLNFRLLHHSGFQNVLHSEHHQRHLSNQKLLG